jgi:hypothetical protein
MRVSIRQPNPGIANGFLEADNRGLTERVHAVRDHRMVALRAYRKAVADFQPSGGFFIGRGPMTARRSAKS